MFSNSFHNIDIQKKALDASWLRQSLIANNLANINTPGYKRSYIDFESTLIDFLDTETIELTRTNPAHFSAKGVNSEFLSPIIKKDRATSYRLDGNNVNVDVEMAANAANQIKYNAMLEQVNGQFNRLKTAIRGGK